MLTYHNNPALKAEFVSRMQAHIAADEVIQGTGYKEGRGCAVGCTYNAYDHSLGPARLGFPPWYDHLRDVIFEGLPPSEAPAWALASLVEVPEGVNMEPVRAQLAIARHERALAALADNAEPYAQQCRDAIQGVIDWLRSGGPESTRSAACSAAQSAAQSAAWSAEAAARSAAQSAARSAELAACSAAQSAAWSAQSAAWTTACSAAQSAACSAARSAARSAESAARTTARSAARSAVWSAAAEAAAEAAELAHYQWERDTLIALLRALKPAEITT